jgi:hypothetical protein
MLVSISLLESSKRISLARMAKAKAQLLRSWRSGWTNSQQGMRRSVPSRFQRVSPGIRASEGNVGASVRQQDE